jgi:hypothetical protein
VKLRFDDDDICEAFDRLIGTRNLGDDRCLCFLIDDIYHFTRDTLERNQNFIELEKPVAHTDIEGRG